MEEYTYKLNFPHTKGAKPIFAMGSFSYIALVII